MRIRKELITALVALVAPLLALGQASSINTFSPYTLYGLGDLTTQGPAYLRAMGGAGVAYNSPSRVNFLNPAAAGAGLQRSFLLNVGLEGGNYYLKSETTKSSFNTFNISNIAIQFPLASRLNASVSVTPFSSVGYRITQPGPVTDELDISEFQYSGEGGVNQFKAGLGYALGKRVFLGAEAIYYLGNIDRSMDALLATYNAEAQSSIYGYEQNKISKFYFNLGVQANLVMTSKELLTVGATYQPGGDLNPKTKRFIPSGDIYGDTVLYTSTLSDFRMADMLTVGAAFHTHKASIVADYSFQNWGKGNQHSGLNREKIAFRNTNSFKIGGEYTPNRLDVRHFMNRLTYRIGFRYSDYYMRMNDHDIAEKAITVGVGVPMRMAGMSAINVGLEAGTRGAVKPDLIRENFYKVTIGFSLFGEDYWFVKPKFD